MSGAKIAMTTKTSVIAAPIQSIDARDAARLANRLRARGARRAAESAAPDDVPRRRGCHQYRIRGSMNALTKSMSRLTTTTTSAKTTMIPCTAA